MKTGVKGKGLDLKFHMNEPQGKVSGLGVGLGVALKWRCDEDEIYLSLVSPN